MQKINLEGLNEEVYYHKLDNGLEVYILKKEKFNTYMAYFITKFGALIDSFVPINEKKVKKFPAGIAHFLEHKLFEQEDGVNVMERFSSYGSICNAFTNYLNTTYLVEGTNNFYENLNFLIDYVQSPYFTLENVEKEKGIIKQELLMTKDNPYKMFYIRVLSNLFVNIPYGRSVLGDNSDIDSITKEDLYLCYNTFYNPSNMCLIIISSEDENKILDSVIENQKNKKFDKINNINVKKYDEPCNVNKEYDEYYDNITKPELSYCIKLKIDYINISSRKYRLYLYILLLMNFGSISPFNLKLKEENKIDGDFDVDCSQYFNYMVLSICVSTDYPNEIIKLIDDKINNITYDKKEFELIKNSFISSVLYGFTSIDSIMNFMYNEYYSYGKITKESYSDINNLNYEEFISVIDLFNNKNKSITIMKPYENKE